MTARAIKIALVQSLDGNLTCVGPDDFKPGEHSDAMEAALGWHLEAGHLPAASYWIWVDLPALPSIPQLKAKAEVREFPRSFVEEMDGE